MTIRNYGKYQNAELLEPALVKPKLTMKLFDTLREKTQGYKPSLIVKNNKFYCFFLKRED